MLEGKEAEKRFASLFDEVRTSTPSQDVHEHWDLQISMKIDVKGKSRVREDDLWWIEIKNVAGKTGWLYGKADAFAFETEDFWIIVLKEDLQRLVDEKCSAEVVEKSGDALYKLYRRKDRKDVLTLIKGFDLIAIAYKIFYKPKEVREDI